MFKIKKTTPKVPTRAVLAETQQNQESYQLQKSAARPLSIRLNRRNASHHTISSQQQIEGKVADQGSLHQEGKATCLEQHASV